MTNLEIAELLQAVAAAYQLNGERENRFRIIAYQRAADSVEHASSELKDLWDDGKLDEIAGIGPGIAQHLDELFKKGSSSHFSQVMEGLPPQMFELMVIPGIGAKTAYKLVTEFGSKISEKNPIGDLEKLAKEGKISTLENFGEESEKDILRSISEVKGRSKRHLLPYAARIADGVIEWLKKENEVLKADPLGSIRRKASTVGDVDIAVATGNPEKVLDHFTKFPKAQRILEKGGTTASIVVPGDMQVDLMVQPQDRYGALLQHFTGSKHHNIALREFALKKNYSLSEYGIRKRGTKGLKKFATEEEFYKFLGLEWIPPELREDMGEIKAALRSAQGKLPGLPTLVELKDIKADLQIHSSFDVETSHDLGESSMQELIYKANNLGYEYIAFTEHNPSHSQHSEKEVVEILKRKREKVDKLNYSLKFDKTVFAEKELRRVKKVFNSLEIDILPNGKLPVPESGLKLLDFALVSVHSSFRMSKLDMTKRVLSGLAEAKVKIFAHPTARKLTQREGIELDWEKIFEFCRSKNKWLEINADPMRLDLPDFLVKEAIAHDVKMSLGTDSHHEDHMDNMEFGVSVARRGWAEKKDILNTSTLNEFERMLK